MLMNNIGTDIHKYTNELIISSFVRSFVRSLFENEYARN